MVSIRLKEIHIAILAIFLFTILIRVPRIGAISYTSDGAHYVLRAFKTLNDPLFTFRAGHESSYWIEMGFVHFYFLTFGLQTFGKINHQFSTEFIEVLLFGIAAVLVYLIARELTDNKKVWYASAFLFSVSLMVYTYSLTTFADTSVTFMLVASLYTFIKGIKTYSGKFNYWLMLSSILFAFTILTKYTVLVAYVVTVIWLITFKMKHILKIKNFVYLIPFVIPAIFFTYYAIIWPGMPFMFGNFEGRALPYTTTLLGTGSIKLPLVGVDHMGNTCALGNMDGIPFILVPLTMLFIWMPIDTMFGILFLVIFLFRIFIKNINKKIIYLAGTVGLMIFFWFVWYSRIGLVIAGGIFLLSFYNFFKGKTINKTDQIILYLSLIVLTYLFFIQRTSYNTNWLLPISPIISIFAGLQIGKIKKIPYQLLIVISLSYTIFMLSNLDYNVPREMGKWIAQNAPPNTLILADDQQRIGLYSGRAAALIFTMDNRTIEYLVETGQVKYLTFLPGDEYADWLENRQELKNNINARVVKKVYYKNKICGIIYEVG
ncbi:MAG: ArnT family glycosyltransferase [Methanosarcinales archaeon]